MQRVPAKQAKAAGQQGEIPLMSCPRALEPHPAVSGKQKSAFARGHAREVAQLRHQPEIVRQKLAQVFYGEITEGKLLQHRGKGPGQARLQRFPC